jgi:hypothetical protein
MFSMKVTENCASLTCTRMNLIMEDGEENQMHSITEITPKFHVIVTYSLISHVGASRRRLDLHRL